MMQQSQRATICVSCGIRLTERGFATFQCPSCGDKAIGRCVRCRDQGVRYGCPKCSFQGP